MLAAIPVVRSARTGNSAPSNTGGEQEAQVEKVTRETITEERFWRKRPDDRAEDQYVSLRTALRATLQHQGWVVKQVSFIADARSLNE
jgi:hypothetical protein